MANDRHGPDAQAARLLDEHRAGTRFQPLGADAGVSSVAMAYDIQDRFVRLLQADTGGRPAGYKIGLTSQRMQVMCGIDQPIAGVVLSGRIHGSGATVKLRDFGRLGIEFEVGIRIARDQPRTGRAFTTETITDLVEAVCPAFELVDDRAADYTALNAISLIADNSWNGGVVLGKFSNRWPDLAAITGVVAVDGVEVDRGAGAEVLGHPFAPLAWLANHLAQRGQGLRAGEIVLTGSMVRTRFAKSGEHYRFTLSDLGQVEVAVA